MNKKIDKAALASRIHALEGLSSEDKSALLELLSEQKRYGLVWEDKPEEVEALLREKLPVLTEDTTKRIPSSDENAPNHILIEGDNYPALVALQYAYEGKVDVIYIDPPYNTGNKDFVYNDSYVDSEDGYRHSKWLSFMSKRLNIAKRLLSDRGVIFISIDDNEQANLKLLCDEVFGSEKFRNTILDRRRTKTLNLQFAQNGLKTLNVGAEYILVYANAGYLFKEMQIQKKDVPTKGTWNVFWSNADRPSMRYELLGFTPSSGQWRWSMELALEAVKNYYEYESNHNSISLEEYWESSGRTKRFIRRIPNGTGKNGGVQYWVAPSDTFLRTSNWTDLEVSQIHKEFDLNFDNPKNIELIKEILKAPFEKTNIILDFFAGSGTTLHATMQLNAEDGGKRQCILVTNNENNICEEVTYERNKRVIQGYTTPKGQQVEGLKNNNLRYYKVDFVEREKTAANQKELMKASTDLLCIKENLYHEETCFEGLKLHPQIARCFSDGIEGGKKMLIIYEPNAIPVIVKRIEQMSVGKENKLKVYVMAEGQYPYTEDFESVLSKVELRAMPHALYQAMRQVLPPLAEADNTEPDMEVSDEEADGSIYKSEEQ